MERLPKMLSQKRHVTDAVHRISIQTHYVTESRRRILSQKLSCEERVAPNDILYV